MNRKQHITPLDKEALLPVPGLQYARSLIDIAIHVSRRSAMEAAVKPLPNSLQSRKRH